MFDQPADGSGPGQPHAPAGMRELTPRPPAQPTAPQPIAPQPIAPQPIAAQVAAPLAYPMPAAAPYPGFEPVPAMAPALAPDLASDRPGPDDSVVARDDHLEGTFTSRGTVHVIGSIKGRVEAIRLHIDEGARVEADVVVDEAVIAGQLVGGLTCRQRLEVRPTGRLSGHVETYRVMLHEGASVEGEVHMLAEPGRPGSETIRGSAPVRGGQGPTAEAPPSEARTTQRAATVAIAEASADPAPRTAPRSSARVSGPGPSQDTVRVAPRGSSPVGNGTRSGL